MTLTLANQEIPQIAVATKLVAVCDTQPVMAEGIRTLLRDCPDLVFRESVNTLAQAEALIRQSGVEAILNPGVADGFEAGRWPAGG